MNTDTEIAVTSHQPPATSHQLPLSSIVCGDNVAVMKTWPDDCIDLVVTSPPYDNLRTYGGHSWDFEGVAKELTRLLKPGGVIVWVVGDATVKGSETLTSMRQAIYFKDICGLNVHDTMIYSRQCPTWNITSKRYRHNHEYMFVFSKGKPKTFNPIRDVPVKHMQPRKIKRNRNGNVGYDMWTPQHSQTARGNIWQYAVGSGSASDKIAFEHPAIFPEQLARDHVLSWSHQNSVVFDPFAGSGTTCLAAKENGRRWVGTEINQTYVDICNKRLGIETVKCP